MAQTATRRNTSVPAVIEGGAIYSLQEACDRLNWGRAAYRSARKQGFKVVRRVGRTYVRGTDILKFFASEED